MSRERVADSFCLTDTRIATLSDPKVAAETLHERAIALAEAGFPDEAKRVLLRCLEILPGYESAMQELRRFELEERKLAAATIVADRWSLRKCVSSSATVRSWHAWDGELSEHVLLRCYAGSVSQNRLTRLGENRHPNIEGVRTHIEWESISLQATIRPWSDRVGHRSVCAEKPWIRFQRILDIVSALAWLHRNNLAHGNVASSNVIVGPDSAKLADVGLQYDLDQKPKEAMLEDCYRLGILIAQMYCGREPFEVDAFVPAWKTRHDWSLASAEVLGLPEFIDELVRYLVAKPEVRWTAARALDYLTCRRPTSVDQYLRHVMDVCPAAAIDVAYCDNEPAVKSGKAVKKGEPIVTIYTGYQNAYEYAACDGWAYVVEMHKGRHVVVFPREVPSPDQLLMFANPTWTDDRSRDIDERLMSQSAAAWFRRLDWRPRQVTAAQVDKLVLERPPMIMSRDFQSWAPHMLIDDRWQTFGQARGGMSNVVFMDDLQHGVPTAMKTARTLSNSDHERFEQECRIMLRIPPHPHLICPYHTLVRDGRTYLFLEYAGGGTLRQRIGGRTNVARSLEMLLKIARGIAHLHANSVIHRDLKPENILVDGEGEPKISDFGLATYVLFESDGQGEGGTPPYMAPEQWASLGAAHAAADVYAFGIIAHELLNGEHPLSSLPLTKDEWRAAHLHQQAAGSIADVPTAVAAMIVACQAKDPEQRPSMAEVVEVLTASDLDRELVREELGEEQLLSFANFLYQTEQFAAAESVLRTALTSTPRPSARAWINLKILEMHVGKAQPIDIWDDLHRNMLKHWPSFSQWPAATPFLQALQRSVIVHSSGVRHAVFSPHASRFITCDDEGCLRIWRTHDGAALDWRFDSGRTTKILDGGVGRVYDVEILGNGDVVVIGAKGLQIITPRAGSRFKWQRELSHGEINVSAGLAVAATRGFQRGGFVVIDLENRCVRSDFGDTTEDGWDRIASSPDGGRVALAGRWGVRVVAEARTNRELCRFYCQNSYMGDRANSLFFDDSGEFVFVGDRDAVRYYAREGHTTGQTMRGVWRKGQGRQFFGKGMLVRVTGAGPIVLREFSRTPLACSRSGVYLASCTGGVAIVFDEPRLPNPEPPMLGGRPRATSARVRSELERERMWKAAELGDPEPLADVVEAVRTSYGSQGNSDELFRLYELGSRLGVLVGVRGLWSIWQASFRDEDERDLEPIALGRDIAFGRHRIEGRSGTLLERGDARIVAASTTGNVRVLQRDQNLEVWVDGRPCLALEEKVERARVSPDGRWCITWERYRSLDAWELHEGRCRLAVRLDVGVRDVAFGPEGKAVVLEGELHTLIDLRSASASPLWIRTRNVDSIEFGRRGRYIVSLSSQEGLIRWDSTERGVQQRWTFSSLRGYSHGNRPYCIDTSGRFVYYATREWLGVASTVSGKPIEGRISGGDRGNEIVALPNGCAVVRRGASLEVIGPDPIYVPAHQAIEEAEDGLAGNVWGRCWGRVGEAWTDEDLGNVLADLSRLELARGSDWDLRLQKLRIALSEQLRIRRTSSTCANSWLGLL